MYHRGPDISQFRSTTSRFLRKKVVENRKCTQLPQSDLEHFNEPDLYGFNEPSKACIRYDQSFSRYMPTVESM